MLHKLKVKCENGKFVSSTIELDGNPFPLTEIQIRGEVGDIYRVDATFLVNKIEVDIDAEVLITPIVKIYPPDVRKIIYKELKKEFEKEK